jgi:flagellar biosynthesis protein FlhF
MQIKTFRALNMREALSAVKQELGPDAVILSTQQVKTTGGAFGLFTRPLVEITAAVDREGTRPTGKEPALENSGRSSTRGRGDAHDPEYGGDVHEDRAAILSHGKLVRGWENLQQPRQRPDRLGASFSEHMQNASGVESIRQDLAQIKEELTDLRRLSGLASGERDGWRGFGEDLRGVRRLVGTLVKNDRDLVIQRLTSPLEAAYYWLLETGLDADVVFSLVREVHDTLPSNDEDVNAAIRIAVLDRIAREVKTCGPLLTEERQAKAVMLIGPSGVGKTTTIAKLAALYALRQKRKVALITLDTYRVAAVEQLRVYGNILGLSVDVALTCEDLAGLLRMRKSADLILIDTAGRSPLDQTAMGELKQLVGPNRDVEAHLLLSAATREADLNVVWNRFMTLPVKSVIFSKIDETTQYGSVYNVLQRINLPVSYLSTGQRVPEDLEVATPRLLAELLLDGLRAIREIQTEHSEQLRNASSNPVGITKIPQVSAHRAEQKRNLLGTLRWALAGGFGKKSQE